MISCRSQFLEIVALLTDEYELLDWRRFLLCAALPWPIPSLSQLLVVLQHFKSIDAEHTGYINETEYLQVSVSFHKFKIIHAFFVTFHFGLNSNLSHCT